jgi:putative inorganic carbon (hco3(-)) transporter
MRESAALMSSLSTIPRLHKLLLLFSPWVIFALTIQFSTLRVSLAYMRGFVVSIPYLLVPLLLLKPHTIVRHFPRCVATFLLFAIPTYLFGVITRPYLATDALRIFVFMVPFFLYLHFFLDRAEIATLTDIAMVMMVGYGLFQYLAYMAGHPEYSTWLHVQLGFQQDYGIFPDSRISLLGVRVSSLALEPSYFAYIVGVYFFVTQRPWVRGIMLLGYALSFSLVSLYAVVGIGGYLLFKKLWRWDYAPWVYMLIIFAVHILLRTTLFAERPYPLAVFEQAAGSIDFRYAGLDRYLAADSPVDWLIGVQDIATRNETNFVVTRAPCNISSILVDFGLVGVGLYTWLLYRVSRQNELAALAFFFYGFNTFYLVEWPIVVVCLYLIYHHQMSREQPLDLLAEGRRVLDKLPVRLALRAEIWVVGVCVAASVFLRWMLPVAVVVALLFWLLRWFAADLPMHQTPVDWAFGVLLALVPVTLWITPVPDVTQAQVYRLVTGMALLYAVVHWANTRGRWLLLVAGVVGFGVLLALIAPFSMVWIGGKASFLPETIYTHLVSALPFNIHPNVLGGYLAMVLPIPVALLVAGWPSLSWIVRVLLAVAIVLMGGVLLLTQSRGAWIALAVALAVLVVLVWRWGKVALAIAAVVGTGIVLSPAGALVRDRAFWASSEHRLVIWADVLGLIQEHPLVGIGLGAFPHSYPLVINPFGRVVHAHNLFLQVALDMGVVGGGAWLAIALFVLVAAWGIYRAGQAAGDDWLVGLGIGLLGSQLALLVHGMLDCVIWVQVETAAVVWGIWGVTVAGWVVHCAGGPGENGLGGPDSQTFPAPEEKRNPMPPPTYPK